MFIENIGIRVVYYKLPKADCRCHPFITKEVAASGEHLKGCWLLKGRLVVVNYIWYKAYYVVFYKLLLFTWSLRSIRSLLALAKCWVGVWSLVGTWYVLVSTLGPWVLTIGTRVPR